MSSVSAVPKAWQHLAYLCKFSFHHPTSEDAGDDQAEEQTSEDSRKSRNFMDAGSKF